jgi:transcriptional regulator with XRE-family HTH domain
MRTKQRPKTLYDGAKIEERMKLRKLSDRKLAALTELSRPTIAAIRRGQNTEVENVLAVLAVLDLSPFEVFEPKPNVEAVAHA